MWNKRSPSGLPKMPKLALRLVLQVLAAAALSVALFFAATWAERTVLSRLRWDSQVVTQGLYSALDDLQDYVTDNGLTTGDRAALRAWDRGHSLVALQLVADGAVVYDSDYYGWDLGQKSQEYVKVEDPERGHIEFADATATVSVNLSFYRTLAWRMTLVTLLVCFALFVTLVAVRFSMLIRDVLRIDQGVQVLESGDLSYQIQVSSPDELGDLAESLNRMAQELQWRNEMEDALHARNYDTITAISHDLRTPLTAIMGFTELLQTGQPTPEEQQDYLARILERAGFMRQMTQRLFESSTTHARPSEEARLLDGGAFLRRTLEDMARSLAVSGITLTLAPLPQTPFRLQADPVQLARVFSNLEGNIRSYADPTQPVTLTARLSDGRLFITQTNVPRADAASGSGVGLQNARRILEDHGGALVYDRSSAGFRLELELPVQPEEE